VPGQPRVRMCRRTTRRQPSPQSVYAAAGCGLRAADCGRRAACGHTVVGIEEARVLGLQREKVLLAA
jgi:hypothetical protein